MIASNDNSMCERAQPYYYEYLYGQSQEHIPVESLAHISQCDSCQAEIERLNIVLDEAEEQADQRIGQTSSAVITNLSLHFAYIGTLVNCDTVRPFLPSLAEPVLEVCVPTPITVHLNKCQQCMDDLQTIRRLNLSHKQLCRLGQLFAEKPTEDVTSCSQAQAAILAVVLMSFDQTNKGVLKHFCICPDCRELLYQYREKVRGELLYNQSDQKGFPCEEVSAADIFDYCFPYGINPANDQYAKFRPAFTSHACTCPACLGKMQQLHSTVYSVLEREESGIVTCFKSDDSARELAVGSYDDLYEDWPIKVQAFDKSAKAVAIETETPGTAKGVAVSVKPKQLLSSRSIRLVTKVAAVAATVILAVILLLNVPVAKGVGLEQIYKALEQIKNVCLTTFVPEKSEPIQEVWISRALDIKMFKAETGYVLWDIKNKAQKSRDSNTGLIKTVEFDDGVLMKVKETMDVPLGLLPFNTISVVPADAKWTKTADTSIETNVPGTEVYDLEWFEKGLDGFIINRRWRGYIDTETKLPKRIEWWFKHPEAAEYELRMVIKVAYPDDVEIRTVVENAGF